MKSQFLIGLAFLYSMQTVPAFAKTRGPAATKKVGALDQLPLKNYILSFEDLEQMSPQDRSIYLVGLSNYLTIREIAQDHFMGKVQLGDRKPASESGEVIDLDVMESSGDSASLQKQIIPSIDTNQSSTISEKPEILHLWLKKMNLAGAATLQKAEAVVAVAARLALWAWRPLASATESVWAATSGFATRAWATGATRAGEMVASGTAKVGETAARYKAAGGVTGFLESRVATGLASKLGVSELQAHTVRALMLDVKNIRSIEAAAKAAPFAEKKLYEAQMQAAVKAYEGRIAKIATDPEHAKAIAAALEKTSWGASFVKNGALIAAPMVVIEALKNNETAVKAFEEISNSIGSGYNAVAGAAGAGKDKVMELVNGKPVPPPAEAQPKGLDGQPLQTAWEAVKGEGCIFGLRSSQWKEDRWGGKYCTRHNDSRVEGCGLSAGKLDNSKYLCPSFGLSTEKASEVELFCIPSEPLRDLSVNCNNNLKEKLQKFSLTITKEVYDKFVAAIRFNTEKEELTMEKYCERASVKQGTECGALLAVKKMFESQPGIAQTLVAAAKPPAAAPGAPAGTPAPAVPQGADATKKEGT